MALGRSPWRRIRVMRSCRAWVRPAASSSSARKRGAASPEPAKSARARVALDAGASSPSAWPMAATRAASASSSGAAGASAGTCVSGDRGAGGCPSLPTSPDGRGSRGAERGGVVVALVADGDVLVGVGGIESRSKKSSSIGFTWGEGFFAPLGRDPSPPSPVDVPSLVGRLSVPLFLAPAHSGPCSAHATLSWLRGDSSGAAALSRRPSSRASPSTAAKKGRRS